LGAILFFRKGSHNRFSYDKFVKQWRLILKSISIAKIPDG
jgi:hypothetical protein